MALCLCAWTAKLKQWVSKKAAWSSPAVSSAHDFLMHCSHPPSSGVISIVRCVCVCVCVCVSCVKLWSSVDLIGNSTAQEQKKNTSVWESDIEKLRNVELFSLDFKLAISSLSECINFCLLNASSKLSQETYRNHGRCWLILFYSAVRLFIST